ncbi:MAG: ATP-binding cassette domain-containing protein [Alphaproteobacteria bacterium]|nr:MAG: ATP-binding cassette domain-containing protein [Alphaproteobacteria bacterium]
MLLELKNITTIINGVKIHDNLNFSISAGEIVSLMGGSGSGKTTFANVVLNFMPITSGEIFFLGKRIQNVDSLNSKIAYQVQNNALFADKTVIENIAFPLRYVANLEWNIAIELAFRKLFLVNLNYDDAYKYPHMLSGGMMKKVALARAIATDPNLLILDEPFSGLDNVNLKHIQELIYKLSKKMSIICITHHFLKSDRYYMLQSGKFNQISESEVKVNYAFF